MKQLGLRRLATGALVAALLVAVVVCSVASGTAAGGERRQAMRATLPGQQVWRDGVSSYLFGATDDIEWDEQHNLETEPGIQQALHRAGFTWLRTFIPDGADDQVLEERISTVENTGAACMGLLLDIYNTAWVEHVVRYFGDRCLMYEFGGEPDYRGISVAEFLRVWNAEIPVLRRINPRAKFFGPTTGATSYDYMRAFLLGVKASGVLPDAVSVDYYPCNGDTQSACLAKASSFGTVARTIRGMVHDVLGQELPVGFTEWNYDPTNPPAAYGDDPAFMAAFTAAALRAMVDAGVDFAAQFDVASYSGYGRLDMVDRLTGRPKAQFDTIAAFIRRYRPEGGGATAP